MQEGLGQPSLVQLPHLLDRLFFPCHPHWVRPGQHGLRRPSLATSRVTLTGYFISRSLSFTI